MFRVLQPVWRKLPLAYEGEDFPEHGYYYRVAEWKEIGVARDMADALAKFPRSRKNGYSPVLEPINGVH